MAELLVGIVVFAGGQSFLAVLVGAEPDISPPSVPANLQLSGRSATEVDISWDASTDDIAVAGYHVFRNGTQVADVTATGFNDTGRTPNTNYSYTVSAYDAASNESAPSSPLNTATLADTSPPSVPVNVHQTAQTTGSITIAWNASADNVAVAGYNIYRNGSLLRSQTGTSFTDSGLAVYSAYNYNVSAYDAAGNTSNLSTTLVASTSPDTTPPNVPDNIVETDQSISTITLAWDASTDDVGVAGYTIYRNGSLAGTSGGSSYTDSGLSVGTSYTYTITAHDAAGNFSAESAPFSASSSTDTTPPTIPANPRTTDVQDGSIALAWDASTDDVGVTGYKVYRDGSLVGTSDTTAFTDTGLTPDTTYTYTVKAYDAANNASAASQGLGATTAHDTTVPSTPPNLHASGTTDTTITLSWDAATDNIAVSGYDVYRDGSHITSTTGTSFTDAGLSVDTAYTYTVRSSDASGNHSSQSSPLDVSTLPDEVAPSAPDGLNSTNQTTTSIDLSWNSGSDDVSVAGYHVYRDGILAGSPTVTDFNDSSLRYGTQFTYTVRTVDDAGNESVDSTAVQVSTLPDTAPPSVQLTAPTSGSTIKLTVPLTAAASDDLALSKVQFYVDTTLIKTITSAPFSFNWNSYGVHNGSHTLTAKAYDVSGNTASSAATVAVNNPPPPLSGDLNGDHKVNIFDLSILLAHWDDPGSGDFNKNGRVDIFDLSYLLSHYGTDNSNYH